MENKSFVIDSNVFVAFYDEADSNNSLAKSALKELSKGQLIVHPYVIQEVSTILTYRFGIIMAKKFLGDIKKSDNVVIPFVNISGDMDFFISLAKKVAFTDATLIALSKESGAALLTFDKQMIRIAKSV